MSSMSGKPVSAARAFRESGPRAALYWGAQVLFAGWLAVKQLAWSPLHQAGVALGSLPAAASIAVALLVVGFAARFQGRTQIVALLVLDAALTTLYEVQLLYFRQFSDFASVADLTFAWQAAAVGGAARALLRGSDLVLWSDVAALACALAAVRNPPSLRPGLANALVGAGVLLFAVPAAALLDRPLTGPLRLGIARAEAAATVNVVGYEMFDALAFFGRRIGGGAKRSGRDALADALSYHRDRDVSPGPLTGAERGRNVIVVQLESVQRFAAGSSVGGVPVTPNLDALARESIAFDLAFTQAAQGTSSDAELLAGCSLYPLRTGSAFTDRYDGHYRCLPEVLRGAGYRTLAMHANWPNFWNRDRMYPAMGFDTFLSIRDFDREPVIGFGLADGRFFEQAVERLEQTPQPFYAMLVTLSNHAPFDDPHLPRTLPLGELRGTYLGDYLDSVKFADAALGTLVERLRATGLLDRSVLVVYGDHAGVARSAKGTEKLDLPRERADVWLQYEARVPLLIRLPGARHAQVRQDAVGQIDIAPTIADLLGVPMESTFFHGRRLLADGPRPVVFPDGSAFTDELVFIGPEQRWGAPACVEASSGAAIAMERCDALATHAARELAVSRAEVDQDLFRRMLAARAPAGE